jgi:hypothetical protein
MNEAGVDRTILFSTLVHPELADDAESFEKEMNALTEILQGKRNPKESRERAIDAQISVIRGSPSKFLGFGSVPLGLSSQETANWIKKKVVENNFCGLGEFTVAPGQVPQLKVIFLASQEFGHLPIWLHTFWPLGLEDLRSIDQLSKKYPAVPVILGHLGGTNWLDAIKMAKGNPSLYLDLSATFSTVAPQMAMKELPERTLFSSDAPYGDPLLARNAIERIAAGDYVKECVLGGNIAELLRI